MHKLPSENHEFSENERWIFGQIYSWADMMTDVSREMILLGFNAEDLYIRFKLEKTFLLLFPSL